MKTDPDSSRTDQVRVVVVDGARSASYEQLLDASDGLRRPVHLQGLCANTVASQTWTLDRLLSLEPQALVTAEFYADADRRKPHKHVIKPFAEIAPIMAADPERWFIAEEDLDLVFSRVAAELPRLPVLPDDARKVIRTVFFGRNTQSAMHFHTRDQAILAHLRGTKRVILADPKATSVLATNSAFGGRPQYSAYGPDAGANAARYFDDLVGAQSQLVVLAPGDALFIPLHWWHWVEGDGECLSVTTFWRASFREWVFPAPGIRAATALGIAETAKMVRRVAGRLKRAS